MKPVWQDIDGVAAEAQLRGLRRRLSELDDVLAGQQRILRMQPGSFAFRLSCESLLQIQARLQTELVELVRHRQEEKVLFALQGREFADNSAEIGYLGSFILRLQKLYSSLAQAISTGPTLRGPIAQTIRNATTLRLATVFPSSFGMEMFVPSSFDMYGNSISSDALAALFQLLASASDEKTLMQRSGEYGRRTTSHLAHVAAALQHADATLTITWSDYSGTQHSWKSDPSAIGRIVDYYNKTTETRTEEKILEARLVGASLVKNRFELLLSDGTAIEGKFILGLGPVITKAFGAVCKATVGETEYRDKATGQSRIYYSLVALESRE